MERWLLPFHTKSRFKYINPTLIHTPDVCFDSQAQYEGFKKSIQQLGVIVPIIVRKQPDGYELICGAKRLKAAVDCGFERVPCVILKVSDSEADKIRLAENHQRAEPNFVTTAEGLKKLIYSYGLSIEDAAEIAGLPLEEATGLLHTLRLGQNMLTAIRKIGFTQRHAKALLRLNDDNVREAALCEMAYRSIEADAAEKYIDALLSHGEEAAPSPPRQIYVMKDVRFFLNSVEHGVEIMRNGGIEAECSHISDNQGVTLTIRIPCATEQLNAS